MEKIFARFYQVDTSHTREQEGSGIGLSLVKELVELHNGEILVQSQIGIGSCFIVRLPLQLADFEETVISGPALDNAKKDLSPFDQAAYEELMLAQPLMEDADPEAPLALIIEDNPEVRFFIHENLKNIFQVMEAGDDEEG